MLKFLEYLFKVISLVVIVLLLFFPFIIISICIKVDSRGPVIHWSKRVGRNNKIFLMPKFRTMKVNTPDLATHLLKNRNNFVTRVGKILRKLSLDEIPQIFSIIRGDMNFIGPRPALYNQYDLIKLRNKFSLSSIKPGITGWAQINGRDALSIEEKVRLECEFAKYNSFQMKFFILYKTLLVVMFQKNIS